MIRPVMVLWVALTVALTGVACASVARAEPAPPCSFTLSPPHLVQVSGANMVTATLAPAGCRMPARPYLSVACLQLQGNDSADQCMQAKGPDTAQVYYTPYRPGATYVSTGRGCASLVQNLPDWNCQMLGPYIATL